MEERNLNTWEEFEKELSDIRAEYDRSDAKFKFILILIVPRAGKILLAIKHDSRPESGSGCSLRTIIASSQTFGRRLRLSRTKSGRFPVTLRSRMPSKSTTNSAGTICFGSVPRICLHGVPETSRISIATVGLDEVSIRRCLFRLQQGDSQKDSLNRAHQWVSRSIWNCVLPQSGKHPAFAYQPGQPPSLGIAYRHDQPARKIFELRHERYVSDDQFEELRMSIIADRSRARGIGTLLRQRASVA